MVSALAVNLPPSVFEASPHAACVVDGAGVIVRGNERWHRCIGSTGEGRWLEHVHADEREQVAARFAELVGRSPDARSTSFDCRFRHADGSFRWLAWSLCAAPEDGLLYLFARDIDEDRRAQEVCREERLFLRSIADNIPLSLLVKDARDLSIVLWNQMTASSTELSREQMLGQVGHGLYVPEELARLHDVDREVLASGELRTSEVTITRPTTGPRLIQLTEVPVRDELGNPRWLLVIGDDITERRRIELELRQLNGELERRVDERTGALRAAVTELRQEMAERERAEHALRASEELLRQAQKLEAVGLLAGGVAHDFNNMLSVVLSYCDLLLADLPASGAHRGAVEQIRQAGQRAASLTRQLLAFSRRQVLTPKVVDLNDVVSQMSRMLEPLIGEDIALMLDLAANIAPIRVDPGQLEQVIMNLVVNARDAMPKGGKLVIGTAQTELDEVSARAIGVAPGRFTVLVLRDTGTGIEPDIVDRIFEPFFTTKAPGKGTGLGLSTVFGIVKQSEGAVAVESEPARGTTFRVYFPVFDATPNQDRTGAVEATRSSRRETVLLVEDERQVREVTSSILARSGYVVLKAATPEEAIALSDAQEGTIHLLLTDLVMPGMNGGALAALLRAKRPDLRVLLMSGYADEKALASDAAITSFEFLQKPLTRQVLLETIERVLARG